MSATFWVHILIVLTFIQCQTQNTSTSTDTPPPMNVSNSDSDGSTLSTLMNTKVSLLVMILSILITMICCCICWLCSINILSTHKKKHDKKTTATHHESISSRSKSDGNASLKSPKSHKSDFDVVREMEIEMQITKGSINEHITTQNNMITTQMSMSSVYDVDGQEITIPQNAQNSPSIVNIGKKSPSTIVIQHSSANKKKNSDNNNKFNKRRRSSNRLQVTNKSVFDSPSINLATLPNNNTVYDYGASLMALDGSILRGTYGSEGLGIINRLGTDSFSKIRTLKRNSEDAEKHSKGKSIIDEISGNVQRNMAQLADDEFEVLNTPSIGPVVHTKQ